jgi:hypothetical protein
MAPKAQKKNAKIVPNLFFVKLPKTKATKPVKGKH